MFFHFILLHEEAKGLFADLLGIQLWIFFDHTALHVDDQILSAGLAAVFDHAFFLEGHRHRREDALSFRDDVLLMLPQRDSGDRARDKQHGNRDQCDI